MGMQSVAPMWMYTPAPTASRRPTAALSIGLLERHEETGETRETPRKEVPVKVYARRQMLGTACTYLASTMMTPMRTVRPDMTLRARAFSGLRLPCASTHKAQVNLSVMSLAQRGPGYRLR